MRVAITGGTGFVGGHLAKSLAASGHDVVVLARGADNRPWAREILELPRVALVRAGIGDEQALVRAFDGCDAVAHCAGINREIGPQTYEAVHVRGTANVVRGTEAAGVDRLAFVSFLRARPGCGSPYHESKWAAEELVRASSCEWTVLKPGMMFGRGDHMLDHLSQALYTFPIFLGIGPRRVRPLAVEDAVEVLVAALGDGGLQRKTVGLVGPTEIGFDDAARLVARVLEKRRAFVTVPIAFHYLFARLAEATMTVPLVSRAQVRILREEVVEPLNAPDEVPTELAPRTLFDEESIRAGLPEAGPFRIDDLRWFTKRGGGPESPAVLQSCRPGRPPHPLRHEPATGSVPPWRDRTLTRRRGGVRGGRAENLQGAARSLSHPRPRRSVAQHEPDRGHARGSSSMRAGS
jgi:NADH dehydrogenase